MADNVAVTAGAGTSIAADEVVDGTLGTVKVQMVKIMDGTLDGTAKMKILAASTAPTAADPAVVVAISPNGQLSGQQTMSSSAPVVISSDQSAVPAKGDVAAGSADSGAPLKQGFYGTTSQSGLTLVTNAQRVNGVAGVDGVQITRPHTNLEDILTASITCTAGANTSAIAAQGASIKIYVSGCIIFNNGTSNGSLLLTDGSGGTTKAKVPFPASTGTVVTFPHPIALTANTALFADPSGSDNIDVTVFGFKSKI